MREPKGVWFWIWNLINSCDGDVDRIIATCQQFGITGVLLKTSDGEWDWSRRNKLTEMVEKCHAANIGIAAWNYSVGDWEGPAIGFEGGDYHRCTIAEELNLVEKAINAGIDFFVVDAEMEWARRQSPDDHAGRYIAEMRRRFGTFPIGFSNAPRANIGFAGYPITRMVQKGAFDFWMPQNYVNGWGVPEQLDLWTQRGAGLVTDTAMPPNMGGLPVYPAYDVLNKNGGSPDHGFFIEAAKCAIRYGMTGLSYWQWEATPPDVWAEVPDTTSIFAAQTPPLLPLPENDSANPAAWHCAKTDIWVVEKAFLDRYMKEGSNALELFGYPWRGMTVDGNGRKIQVFERARFELQPDGGVTLGRLGAEAYPK